MKLIEAIKHDKRCLKEEKEYLTDLKDKTSQARQYFDKTGHSASR